MEAVWRILQHAEPDDFVISTAESYAVRDFLDEIFGVVNLDWQNFVEISDRYKRPAEVPALLGDSTKARKVLGWKPTVSFKELCRMMLQSDLSSKGFTLEQARKKAETLKSSKARAK